MGWTDEALSMDDLVKRNGLYFKKFTAIPFSGEISGLHNGKFYSGRKDGAWETYHENGQLKIKVSYKNGKPHGSYEEYFDNGNSEWQGAYKDGQLKITADYKDGVMQR